VLVYAYNHGGTTVAAFVAAAQLVKEVLLAAVTGHAPTLTAADRLASDLLPADAPPAAADA
jgi:hypothetical protein